MSSALEHSTSCLRGTVADKFKVYSPLLTSKHEKDSPPEYLHPFWALLWSVGPDAPANMEWQTVLFTDKGDDKANWNAFQNYTGLRRLISISQLRGTRRP